MKRTLQSSTAHQQQEIAFSQKGRTSVSSLSSKLRQHGPTNNPFDCAELGSCLKRVKISVSSPGEICLSNDLEHLIRQCGWKKVIDDDSCVLLHSHQSQSQQQKFISDVCEWKWYHDPTKRVFITRDPVDSLRLRLVLFIPRQQPSIQQCQFSLEYEEWNFYVQFPRMYPHFPPDVYRLFKRFSSVHNDSSFNRNPQQQQPSIVPHVSTAQVQVRQSLRRCTGTTANAMPQDEQIMYNDCKNNNVQVYHYDDWTPIQRLGDLIDWLVQLPYKDTVKQQQHGTDNSSDMEVETDSQDPINGKIHLPTNHNGAKEGRKHKELLYNPTRFDIGFVP